METTRKLSSTLKIEAGKYYRAKKPLKCLDGGFNDRHVLWVSADGTQVQYNSYNVAIGRHYPTVSIEQFLKWAGHEITKEEYVNTLYGHPDNNVDNQIYREGES